jgi:hypothetical protein
MHIGVQIVLLCILCNMGVWKLVGVPNTYDENFGTSLYVKQNGNVASCKDLDIKFCQNPSWSTIVVTCRWTHRHIPPYAVRFHCMIVIQWMQNNCTVILFYIQASWSVGVQAMGPHVCHISGETNKHTRKAWINFNQKMWQFLSLNAISSDNPSID